MSDQNIPYHEMLFHAIETKRLYLKNIACEDRDFIFEQFSDPDVTKYLLDEEPYTSISEADDIIEFYNIPEPRNQHRWILVLKENGVKIGTCGFHRWNVEEGSVELGYDLKKEYWGRGLMSEALEAILLFAKNEMQVKRIDAHIYPENQRSVSLVQKFGFLCRDETVIYTFRGTDYLHYIYTLKI